MHKKAVKSELPEMPRQAQVGDRIRVKPERMAEIGKACETAGWNVDLYEVRTVTREDRWNPGGGRRLFVDGPPFAFSDRDVMLAWSNEDDRRTKLRSLGWRV